MHTLGGNGNGDHYATFDYSYEQGTLKDIFVNAFECSGAYYVRNSYIKKKVNGSWVTILSKSQNQGAQTYNQHYDLSDSTAITICATAYGQGQSTRWKGLIIS